MIGILRRSSHCGVVLILGLHALYMGFALGREAQIGQARFSPIIHGRWVTLDTGYAWPVLYAAAGFACLWFHRRPLDRQWWAWSGALLGGAYFSRGMLIVQTALEDGWSYKYAIGAATWAAWAGVVMQLWLHQFRPRSR